MNGRVAAVVLAAGHGKRMRSGRPKPLHPVCGRPMLAYVLDALRDTEVERIVVVVGHGAEQVTKEISQLEAPAVVGFVEQRVQRGTGDAASVGLTGLPDHFDEGTVIVLPGDTPLLRRETLRALVDQHVASKAACTMLTAVLDDPTGYGRIVRDDQGRISRIVEQRDATPDELSVREVNTSVYCFRRSLLAPALRRLTPDNAQGEYYLTDVVQVLHDTGHPLASFTVTDPVETQGVNDRAQLAGAEAVLRRRINDEWMAHGVTMVDPAHTYVEATVRLAADVTLLPGTMLEGRTVIGSGARIGPNSRLVDCAVGEHAVVTATDGRDAEIGPRAVVGPYAVLEPGAQVDAGTGTGPFYTARCSDLEGPEG